MQKELMLWISDLLAGGSVAGDTPELATLSYASWAETLRSEYDSESIRRIVETTIREDSPLSLREHLEILGDCGCNRTDVVWKKYIFGLCVGVKGSQQAIQPYRERRGGSFTN